MENEHMTAMEEFLELLEFHSRYSPAIKAILDTRNDEYLEKERQQSQAEFERGYKIGSISK